MEEKCFQQSDKFAGYVGEGLHLYNVGMEVTTTLLCKLNEPFSKLRMAFFFKHEYIFLRNKEMQQSLQFIVNIKRNASRLCR